ncbi:MAG TPA: antibiotic ABC transporter ATP-binding protein, partial [Flavobacteriaceae bacterium]|nr:antibiotic ABC transporter ATP-binding protein [Flavobacteriaceae bacterium]
AGEDPSQGLWLAVGLILVLFLLKNLFNYLAMYYITYLRNGVLKDIRNQVYQKLIHLPMGYFTDRKKGDLMTRMTTDVLEVQHSMLSVLELMVREPLTILFTLVVMMLISPQLTLFVFVFIPISGWIISVVGKSLKKQSEQVQDIQGQMLAQTEETITGLKMIKAFVAENHFSQKFSKITQQFFQYSNKLLNRQNLASPLSEFLGIAVIGGLLVYGGTLVLIDGSLNASSFIAYISLAYNILTPAKAISKAAYGVKKADAAAGRIIELLEETDPIQKAERPVVAAPLTQSIRFEGVHFGYGAKEVLHNINFEIKQGQTVALVGQSGSGKSTLAQLLLRFYDPTQGTILWDESPVFSLEIGSLRQQMALVAQDALLFHDSIAHNIAMGKPDASRESIIQAAKAAHAHEFIEQLENSYDTSIGDAGNKLSGGQKQRISIARALLTNPSLLILDEATSALDTQSERGVQEALNILMKDRTTLVIAHRLSTVQHADLILVMHQGKIVERGTHQSLIENNGYYQQLVSMQQLAAD